VTGANTSQSTKSNRSDSPYLDRLKALRIGGFVKSANDETNALTNRMVAVSTGMDEFERKVVMARTQDIRSMIAHKLQRKEEEVNAASDDSGVLRVTWRTP
jgi:hypothetical protein